MVSKDEWYFIHRNGLMSGGFHKFSSGNFAVRNDILVEMLEGIKFGSIVEVAGAEADLAERLLKKYDFIVKYDWSDMVEEAKEYAHNRIEDLRFEATILDLDTESPPKADLFICTALEHTLRYIEIIEELNPGTLVLLSLPSFDSIGHRVYFPQFTDIINSYGKRLDFIKVQVFINAQGLRIGFIEFVKIFLKRVGLLDGFRKMGVFKRGCGRESVNYKWLILAKRNHLCQL